MSHLAGLFRLGNDAEVRYTQSGQPVASLSLAYAFGKKGEDGKRPTQWIDASLWGERAEGLAPHLTKGQALMCVIEDPHIESYRKGDGTQGTKLAGRIQTIEFAGSKPAEGQQRQPAAAAPAKPRPAAPEGGSGFDDMDSDIPF